MSNKSISPEQLNKAFMEAQFGEFINEAYDALVANRPRPTISERGFVEVYLPIFSGQVGQYKDNPYKASIDTWVKNVAKSDFNEVDVVDNQGNVLYTVPPMTDSSMINVRNKNSKEMAHAVLMTKMLQSNAIGKTGSNYSYDYFNKNSGKVVNEDQTYNPRYNQMWIDIFKRYNLSPPGVDLGNDNNKAKDNTSGISEKDLDWDDDF